MNKKKVIVPIVAGVATLGILTGVSYAYFSAKITENNKTETIMKSNELGLTFTGVSEINANSMIPGDSFTKTFSVENTSNRAVTYNIYMENITNEFNEDLVYTLTDDNGEVVSETALPVTNTGKSYLKTNISIDTGVTKNYTLKIEYKYLDTPQNDYQGSSFNATLGIDTEQIQEEVAWVPAYYAFGDPTTSSATDYTTLGRNVFVGLDSDGSQKGVCIVRNGELACFKNNNWDEEQNHIQEVFSDISCTSNSYTVDCNDGYFGCYVNSDGDVACGDNLAGFACDVNSSGRVNCAG